jgi:two-component system, OmpR family, response regulator ResD
LGATILVVEDDHRIAALVVRNLRAVGYECAVVHDGDAALRELEHARPSLLVLDLVLPGTGGLDIARQVRREGDVPILVLTARSSEADKVLGFEVGADDYMTKPFSTAELVARVRALLRRTTASPRAQVLEFRGLRIDPARREAEVDGVRVVLTTLEFDLLHYAASRPGHVLTREVLMEQVWGSDRFVGDRSIDNLVSRLRRKLEVDPDAPRYLQTVWGAGYRFAEPSS